MATVIAQKMEAIGTNDAALAEHVGCDRSMVTRIRLGKVQPSLSLAVKLAAALDLPADAFLRAKSKPHQEAGEAAA